MSNTELKTEHSLWALKPRQPVPSRIFSCRESSVRSRSPIQEILLRHWLERGVDDLHIPIRRLRTNVCDQLRKGRTESINKGRFVI